MTLPRPAGVAGNDWKAVDVDPLDAVVPREGVSVVISYYEAADALALTLAALERQTYPRELIEVVIADDGSDPPLERPDSPLNVVVVHQEDRGFGLARARNTGAKAASNDIVIFLDCDMLPEAGWVAAHARWHHVLSDALTLGFRGHVDTVGLTESDVRDHSGALVDRFDHVERPEWIEYHMARTNDLTSADDDLFRMVTGGNLGMRRSFLDEAGWFDESFDQWGAEDTEFGYRAWSRGALLVPERAAFCLHQGLGTSPDESEAESLEHQRAKIAHLIAHRGFRRATPGRSFTVPQYVVTIEPGTAGDTLETVEQLLANRVHDMICWVPPRPGDGQFEWLRRQLEPDARVSFGTRDDAIASVPHAAFHVSVPAGARLREYALGNLRTELGDASGATADLKDGSTVTITRLRSLHKASRNGSPIDEVITIDWRDIGIRAAGSKGRGRINPLRRLRDPDSRAGRVLRQVQRIRTPAQAWRFVKWAGGAVRQRLTRSSGRLPPAPELTSSSTGAAALADYPLGAEITTAGSDAAAVFAASSRVQEHTSGRRADVVIADDAGLVDDAGIPVVDLSTASRLLSVSAFDPRAANPVRWIRAHDSSVVTLGPRDALGEGARATATVSRQDVERLRHVHHVEDAAAHHAGPAARAAVLANLAARGVVVRIVEHSPPLREALGSDLYEAMRSDRISDADDHEREAISIRMRRLAHRDHSLRSRARAVVDAAGLAPTPPLPVSILLATNRPDYLDAALAAVAKQTYPNLELVLALHGGSFSGSVETQAGELDQPVRVVRVAHELTLGDALNTAVSAAGGQLLTKFDDDDLYSPEHVWDLVLAHAYSGAELVAKAAEYVYLAGSDVTIHRFVGRGETFSTTLAGGTMLISRDDLATAGGWQRIPRSVDRGLIDDVERSGGSVYRTHGSGYMLVRHGKGHTWESDDAYFLDQAEDRRVGLDEEFAGI